MEYRNLGRTGLKVSRLCFGALTMGPLQANLPLHEGAAIIAEALDAGVNFIDTAELYDTYGYIREGIRSSPGEVIVATKSYAYTRAGMRESIEKALLELDRDYVDIFMLHEQESALTIKGHWEAVEELLRAREEGKVRFTGVSTHSVEAVRAAWMIPQLEVIHPIINIAGIGIRDGSAEDMLSAIADAASAGKALYGMKALGGGNLISIREKALEFVLSIDGLASVAVGMQSLPEVLYNTAVFSGQKPGKDLEMQLSRRDRKLYIEEWCRGCGECLSKCSQGALRLVGGKAVVDHRLCRLCGYCASACSDMCIKIY